MPEGTQADSSSEAGYGPAFTAALLGDFNDLLAKRRWTAPAILDSAASGDLISQLLGIHCPRCRGGDDDFFHHGAIGGVGRVVT